jgi:hypothetical protein
MPISHKEYSSWSPERFIRWAQKIGPHTADLVKAALAARKHPEKAYRSCLGILRLGTRYGNDRLEAACKRALPAGICSYKGVKNILDAKLDRLEPEAEPDPATHTAHANIRGESYYQ